MKILNPVILNAPSIPLADSALKNGDVHFWLDETNGFLKIKCKTSTGAVYTPQLSLTALFGASLFNLIATGNCVQLTANSVAKNGGSYDWDSQVYSVEGYSRGCALNFKTSQINSALMLGLNSDPILDANYPSLDYAWYLQSDGICIIFENGALITVIGSYTTSTLFTITYDGHNVRYFTDGILRRTVARSIGEPLYLDSTFYTPGGNINTITFMPMGEATI